MKKRFKQIDEPIYTDEPMGESEIIEDFLPPPEKLVFKVDKVKVTMELSRHSVEFFKKQARKHNTQYKKMIRNLLDEYVARHSD